MRSIRYSLSLGFLGFDLRIWRKEAVSNLRDPMARLKLSQKLRILRGHALKKYPNHGGAHDREKRFKYYKKRGEQAHLNLTFVFRRVNHTECVGQFAGLELPNSELAR
jgi:hypothetical protein